MSYKIYPVGQKLLVEPLPPQEEVSEGGVIVSAVNNADLAKAKVVAVSPQLTGVYNEGETVLYYEKRALGVFQGEKLLHLVDGGDGVVQGDVVAILK